MVSCSLLAQLLLEQVGAKEKTSPWLVWIECPQFFSCGFQNTKRLGIVAAKKKEDKNQNQGDDSSFDENLGFSSHFQFPSSQLKKVPYLQVIPLHLLQDFYAARGFVILRGLVILVLGKCERCCLSPSLIKDSLRNRPQRT
jgi:hypothetical protein